MILTGPASDLCMHTGDFPVVMDRFLVLPIQFLARFQNALGQMPKRQKCFRRRQLKNQQLLKTYNFIYFLSNLLIPQQING